MKFKKTLNYFTLYYNIMSSIILGFTMICMIWDYNKIFITIFYFIIYNLHIYKPIFKFIKYHPFFLFVIIVNWSLNVANFLDGIDGLLASISISISMIIMFLLNLNDVSMLNNIIIYFICCLSPFLFLIGHQQKYLWEIQEAYL